MKGQAIDQNDAPMGGVDGLFSLPMPVSHAQKKSATINHTVNAFLLEHSGGRGLTPADVDAFVNTTVDNYLAGQAKKKLSEGKEALEYLSKVYHSPSSIAKAAATADALTQPEQIYDSTLHQNLMPSPITQAIMQYRGAVPDYGPDLVKQRISNANYYSQVYHKAVTNTISEGISLIPRSGNHLLDAAIDSANNLIGFGEYFVAKDFLFGGIAGAMEYIVAHNFPDAPIKDRTLNPQKYINKLRQYGLNLPADKRKEWIQGIVAQIDDATLTHPLNVEVLDRVLGGIDDPNYIVTDANYAAAFDVAMLGLVAFPFGKLLDTVVSGYKATKGALLGSKLWEEVKSSVDDVVPGLKDVTEAAPKPRLKLVSPGEKPKVKLIGEKNGKPHIRVVSQGKKPRVRLVTPVQGLNPDSVVGAAASTARGADKLNAVLLAKDPEAAAKAMGTTVEDIVESTLLPDTALFEHLPNSFLSPSDVSRTVGNMRAGMESAVHAKMGDAQIIFHEEPQKYGFTLKSFVGRKQGVPFETEEQATALAATLPKQWKPEAVYSEDAGGYFVSMEQYHTWSKADQTLPDVLHVRNPLRNFINKLGLHHIMGFGTKITKEASRVRTAAGTETESVKRDMVKILTPFFHLTKGGMNNVLKVIEKYEGQNVTLSYNTLRAEGLSKWEAKAAQSVLEAGQYSYRRLNTILRGEANAEGWKQIVIGKRVRYARPSDKTIALHLDTRERGKVDTSTHSVWELIETGSRSRTVAVPHDSASDYILELPLKMMHDNGIYLPRLNQFNYYIEETLGDKSVIHYGADTIDEAEQAKNLANANRYLGDGSKVEYRLAKEIEQDRESLGPLEDAVKSGALNLNGRRWEEVKNLAGETRIADPADRLSALVHDTASAVGIKLLGQTWDKYLKDTWGVRLMDSGFNRHYASNETLRSAGFTDAQQKEMAKTIWQFMRNATGIEGSLTSGKMLASAKDGIAEAFFNYLPKAGKLVAGKYGEAAGLKLGKGIGREVSGVDSKAIKAMKTIAVNGYLRMNPARQLPIQFSNIPVFAGIDGGTTYTVSGGAFRDSVILATAKDILPKTGVTAPAVELLGDIAEAATKRLAGVFKVTPKHVEELLADWRASRHYDLAKSHALDIETMNDAGVMAKTQLGTAFNNISGFFGAFGYDAAASLEAKTAWLYARNSFKARTGKLPKSYNDWVVVNDRAESLRFDMNVTGVMRYQRGAPGVALQFFAAGLKAMSRAAFLETRFTPQERLRMFAYMFGSYGLTGLGLGSAVNAIADEAGVDLPDWAKQVTMQGFVASFINAIYEVAGQDPAKLDVSGAMAPNLQAINIGKQAWDTVTALSGLGPDGMQLTDLTPASTGFMGRIGEAIHFTKFLLGDVHLPPEEEAKLVSMEWLEVVPGFDSAMQAMVSYNTGLLFDSKGRVIQDVSKSEALGQISGFNPVEVAGLYKQKDDYYRQFSHEEETNAVMQAQKDAFKVIGPLLRKLSDKYDEKDMLTLYNLLRMQGVFTQVALPPLMRSAYYDAMVRDIQQMGDFSGEGFGNSIVQDGRIRGRGIFADEQEAINFLKDGADWPGKEKFILMLEGEQAVLEAIRQGQTTAEDVTNSWEK